MANQQNGWTQDMAAKFAKLLSRGRAHFTSTRLLNHAIEPKNSENFFYLMFQKTRGAIGGQQSNLTVITNARTDKKLSVEVSLRLRISHFFKSLIR